MTERLGAALAAVVFAGTSGITAMEVHQLAAHAVGSRPASAASPAPVAANASHHAGHGGPSQDAGQDHSGHSGHSSHHADPAHEGHEAPAHPSEHTHHDQASVSPVDHEHSGHPEHGSAECTCVGPCASVAPTSLGAPQFAKMGIDEPAHVQYVAAPVDPVHQDPRTYLLPFSNAPPARA